jgi:hypothetical protein
MRLYPNGLYGSLLGSSFQAPAHHGANSHLPNSYNAGFCFSLSYLENKKLDKLFSDSKRQVLQLYLALSQQQESPPAALWDKFVASEFTGSYYAIALGKWFGSFGIYADVNKFLFEVNGVVGSLLKVCESYSEAHLYLKDHLMKEDPVPLDVAAADSPPSLPEGMLDIGGRSVIGNQSKGKKVSCLDILF